MMPPPKDQVVDPSSFLWEGVVQRVYIHTRGVFRLLCRVQYPASFTRSNQDTLESHYWWQLQRSSCWDPHTNHIVLEGTYFELYGVLRLDREMVFSLPPMEWMAGEYLQLSVTTPNDDVVLQVVQFQLYHEVLSFLNLNVRYRLTIVFAMISGWKLGACAGHAVSEFDPVSEPPRSVRCLAPVAASMTNGRNGPDPNRPLRSCVSFHGALPFAFSSRGGRDKQISSLHPVFAWRRNPRKAP